MAQQDFKRFEREIALAIGRMRGGLDGGMRQAMILLAQGVVTMSPVGEPVLWKSKPPPGYAGGQFRANWMFGVGQVNTTVTDERDKTGRPTKARLEGQILSAPMAPVYWISNSLPYAYRLEFEGWSTQSPAGMVRLTLADLPRRMREIWRKR